MPSTLSTNNRTSPTTPQRQPPSPPPPPAHAHIQSNIITPLSFNPFERIIDVGPDSSARNIGQSLTPTENHGSTPADGPPLLLLRSVCSHRRHRHHHRDMPVARPFPRNRTSNMPKTLFCTPDTPHSRHTNHTCALPFSASCGKLHYAITSHGPTESNVQFYHPRAQPDYNPSHNVMRRNNPPHRLHEPALCDFHLRLLYWCN